MLLTACSGWRILLRCDLIRPSAAAGCLLPSHEQDMITNLSLFSGIEMSLSIFHGTK